MYKQMHLPGMQKQCLLSAMTAVSSKGATPVYKQVLQVQSSGVVTKGCPHMRGHARFSTTLLCFITGLYCCLNNNNNNNAFQLMMS